MCCRQVKHRAPSDNDKLNLVPLDQDIQGPALSLDPCFMRHRPITAARTFHLTTAEEHIPFNNPSFDVDVDVETVNIVDGEQMDGNAVALFSGAFMWCHNSPQDLEQTSFEDCTVIPIRHIKALFIYPSIIPRLLANNLLGANVVAQ
jgi:hypothetical protein